MKNNKLLLFVSLLSVSALAGCGSKPSKDDKPIEIVIPEPDQTNVVDNANGSLPEKLIIDNAMVSLLIDEEYEISGLDQYRYPGNNLTFESKDDTIATVDENGKIKGIERGETEIVVTDKDHPELTASIPVTVNVPMSLSNATSAANMFNKIDESFIKSIVDNRVVQQTVYKSEILPTPEEDDAGDQTDGQTDGQNAPENPAAQEEEAELYGPETLYRYTRADEKYVMSYEDAYFRILETDADIEAESGSIDYTSYDWVFYTNIFYDTYIYHQTADSKKYLTIPTQSYESKERIEPVLEIMDNIFTSGRDIFVNAFSSCKLSSFTDMVISDYSNVQDKFAGSNGDGQMLFGCTVTFANSTADQDDESRYGIPFGIPTPGTQKMRYIIKNNRVVGMHVVAETTYDIDNYHYRRVYEVDHVYEDIDEQKSQIYYPSKKDYSRVDGIFDLF